MGNYDAWRTGEIGDDGSHPNSPNYDPRGDEADDEAREDYRERLTACPDFLGEVPMNAQECEAAAAAIKAGDMDKLGRVFLCAAQREADEHITLKSNVTGCTPGEAAERLWRIYRPEIRRDAA